MVVMFSNGGNYGLPVVKFAFGPEALTYAAIFFLTGSVMTYVVGAFFAGSHHRKIAGALEKVWKMPSLYGLALALIVRAGGHPVPEAGQKAGSLVVTPVPLYWRCRALTTWSAMKPSRWMQPGVWTLSPE